MVVSQNGWFMRENAHLEMDEKNGGTPMTKRKPPHAVICREHMIENICSSHEIMLSDI